MRLRRLSDGDSGLSWSSVPASSTASGTAGQIAYDANYQYICVATNAWKRVPLPTWPVVPLLLRFNNNFTNSGTDTISVNPSGVTTSSAQSKFGGYSAYFSGTDSYINFGGESGLAFGTGDFTLEMWAWFASVGNCNLWDGRSEGAVSTFIVISLANSGKIGFDPNGVRQITGPTLSTSQWYHIAVARESGVSRLFVDGVQHGGDYADTNNYSNDATGPVIGIYKPALVAEFSGHIDELRVCKGSALYTANFTPLNTQFPAP